MPGPPHTTQVSDASVTDVTDVTHVPVTADTILDVLDDEQRAVAEALHGPVCVIAGAGTGKTRAITHRIAYGVARGAYDPRRVLAVTFTVKAAGQMRSRLAALETNGVSARTFHSAALRQARWFWPQVMGTDLPQIIDSKYALVSTAASSVRVRTEVRDLAAEIEWAKSSNVSPDLYESAARSARRDVSDADPASIARVYAKYEELKLHRGVIDLEDVLVGTVGLLVNYPEVAEQVRSQYRYLTVDEYQDVSPIQQRLLELWMGDTANLCVVGDPAQTIYSFAGARSSYLQDFPRRYPDAPVVRLFRDYRSTPQVVEVANKVMARAAVGPKHAEDGQASSRGGASGRLTSSPSDSPISGQRSGPVVGAVTLVGQRPMGPSVGFSEYADELSEATAVAKSIGLLVSAGVATSEIAVLYRINAQSANLEQALADAEIAYTVRGSERFFDRGEVRQAVTLLRGAARAGDGDPSGLVADVHGVLSSAGWTPAVPTVIGKARERWESLAAVAALAEQLAQANPNAGLAELVADLDHRAAHAHAPSGAGVTLATIHSAKGLEWDAVFIIGAHEGGLPLVYASTPEEIEEERRLLYVGVTRAREHLHLSWSRARTPGGRGNRSASRFLDGIRPVTATDTSRPAGGRGKSRTVARCRVCGKALATVVDVKLQRCSSCPGDLDEAVFERLRSWRLSVATEAKVPAYVVFTDATLTAIAEIRPESAAKLATISGVGAVKMQRYGSAVLDVCAGREPVDPD